MQNMTNAQLRNSLRRARAAFRRHVGWNHSAARRMEHRVAEITAELAARGEQV